MAAFMIVMEKLHVRICKAEAQAFFHKYGQGKGVLSPLKLSAILLKQPKKQKMDERRGNVLSAHLPASMFIYAFGYSHILL